MLHPAGNKDLGFRGCSCRCGHHWLIVFFVVRHLSKSQVKNTMNVEKQLEYEVPYQYTMDRNATQNEAMNIENEDTYEAYNSAEYETYEEMYAEPYADNKNRT